MKVSNEDRYAQKASWFGVRAQAIHSAAIRDQCSWSKFMFVTPNELCAVD
jgi:hypothetical protein